jgi:hypothetical protein
MLMTDRHPRFFFAGSIAALISLATFGLSHADDAERADDVAMAMVFSMRETTQLHLLAQSLALGSIQGLPPRTLIAQSERAIDGLEGISIPILAKYLKNVDHDPQTRRAFDDIQEMQQRVLAELQAAKSLAESENGDAEKEAFMEASQRYDGFAKQVAENIFSGKPKEQVVQTAQQVVPQAGGRAEERSPNPRVFTDEQWGGIVTELRRQGVARTADDAKAYGGIFVLLKGVFVEKRIPEPSTKQLFGLAKMLNVAFGQIPPEKIESTLKTMLQLARETSTEVASRETLLKLAD